MLKHALTLCLISLPMDAMALTGNELYRLCTEGTRGNSAVCAAYIRGIHEGMSLGEGMAKEGVDYCPPDGLRGEQTKLIVEKYMREKPEIMHKGAGILVGSALYKAFGCESAKPVKTTPSRR